MSEDQKKFLEEHKRKVLLGLDTMEKLSEEEKDAVVHAVTNVILVDLMKGVKGEEQCHCAGLSHRSLSRTGYPRTPAARKTPGYHTPPAPQARP